MEKEWTFDQPTEEGYYWIEEGIGEFKIVQLKRNIWKKLNVLFPGEAHGDDGGAELTHMKGTKWCGPMTPPPTEITKEKNLPDVPIPPLPSLSKEER